MLRDDPFRDIGHDIPVVAIKGRTPREGHRASFVDVYRATPLVPRGRLAEAIVRSAEAIPPAAVTSVVEAVHALVTPVRDRGDAGRLESLRPPAISDGSRAQRRFNAGWIDTNLKLRAEDVGAAANRSWDGVTSAALEATSVYALCLKADGGDVARRISINASTHLQERLVDLAFRGPEPRFVAARRERARTLNDAAEVVLAGREGRDLRGLLADAIAAGGALADPDAAAHVDGVERCAGLFRRTLESAPPPTGPLDELVARLTAATGPRLAWVFDDNGESMFDLAFLDRLLEAGDASVSLILNRSQVSDNIAAEAVLERLASGRYPALDAAVSRGALRWVVDDQPLASLEPARLTAAARDVVAAADVCFCKGVALCETFQVIPADAYYGFVTSSPVSLALTGRDRGSPALLHAPPGEALPVLGGSAEDQREDRGDESEDADDHADPHSA